jgi:hypothetical protein
VLPAASRSEPELKPVLMEEPEGSGAPYFDFV